MTLPTRLTRRLAAAALALACLGATGCVDSPTAASPAAFQDDDPLAQTFDALALTAATNGDLARKEGFEIAALAVRSGTSPSRIEYRLGSGDIDVMDAIVSAVEWAPSIAPAMRPPTRRSMVAWRRSNNGALRVLSVVTPADSAPVVSPLSLGLALNSAAAYAGASAQFQDIATTASSSSLASSTWFATSGWARIHPLRIAGACRRVETNTRIGGVTCEAGRFAVEFSVSMQRMSGSPPQPMSSVTLAVFTPRQQEIDGERLTFACVSPTSDRGCR